VSDDLVLDLDDPDPGRDDREWWATVRVPLWAVLVLVVVGVVSATAATRFWDAREASSLERQAVILVDVPADNGLVGRGDGDNLTLRSAVQVINAGSGAIELGTVVSTSAGVALRGDGDGRVIPAGTAGQVVVRGSIDCRTWIPTEPIQLRLDVTGPDGVLRPTIKTVVIRGAWDDLLETCGVGHP